MSYEYVSNVGLKRSIYRPAGQVAAYDHIILRLKDRLPSVVNLFGSDPTHHTVVDIEYALEYPDKLVTLPFVAISFISEMTKEVGIGMVPGGRDYGELLGMHKAMLLQIDVWGRNSLERDIIADAIMNIMQKSRHYFNSLGFRDVRPYLAGTRAFEQTRDTIYPRVSQTTSRIWRKVMNFEVEYDLIWKPEDDESFGIIEQVDIDGTVWDAESDHRIGHVTDLILDSRYVLKDKLERFVPW